MCIARSYLKAYKLKVEREQKIAEWHMWKQGVYVYEALCDASPILHAFAKKGTKPLPYPSKPYGFDGNEMEKTEEEIEKQKENERLKAIINFNIWQRAVEKHFKKDEVGDNLNGDNNR